MQLIRNNQFDYMKQAIVADVHIFTLKWLIMWVIFTNFAVLIFNLSPGTAFSGCAYLWIFD